MQAFRSDPTLRGYYDAEYIFKTEDEDSQEDLEEDETAALAIQNDDRLMPNWRAPENNTGHKVDWSPNRVRNRNYKKRKNAAASAAEQERRNNTEQEKKKIEVPSVWTLPPAS